MRAPTTTVQAEIYGQNRDLVAVANIVAAQDRTDGHDGVIVTSSVSARPGDAGITELTPFSSGIGATGSAYDVAAYDAASRLFWRTQAVRPLSNKTLSLHTYAGTRNVWPIGLTEQQTRVARTGIDAIRHGIDDNTDTSTAAAELTAAARAGAHGLLVGPGGRIYSEGGRLRIDGSGTLDQPARTRATGESLTALRALRLEPGLAFEIGHDNGVDQGAVEIVDIAPYSHALGAAKIMGEVG